MGRQAQAATSIASKVFWNLPAWLFSAFASVSNQCDLVEAFIAGGAGHTGIHVGIFVGFTRNRRLQIGAGVADRHIGSRIATTRLQELQMAMRVARFALGSRTEYSGNRSEERRAGNARVSPVRYRWLRQH